MFFFQKAFKPNVIGQGKQGNLAKVDVIIPFFSPMYRVKISVETLNWKVSLTQENTYSFSKRMLSG